MWTWKRTKGSIVYWFNNDTFTRNQNYQENNMLLMYKCFSDTGTSKDIGFNLYYKNGYILTSEYDVLPYAGNFVKTLPEKATLYFEGSSFPRNKLDLSPYKRTIKLEKADFIVTEVSAEVTCLDVLYVIFTDTIDIFAIPYVYFAIDFGEDLNNIYKSNYIVNRFKDKLQMLYKGYIKFVVDKTDSLKKFNEGYYQKPFILDTDLDKIVNQYLPDPDLNAILTIHEMLNSSDSATIKLGSIMVSGFNISKWPLTFICLLDSSLNWNKTENGGTLGVVKQVKNTLGIHGGFGLYSIANIIDSTKQKYSKEDMALAQDFVRTLPNLKEFCENKQSFYLENLPFIPDEYKH